MTRRGFLLGLPSSRFQRASQASSILSFVLAETSFLYFSMKMAMASMSHWAALWPDWRHASQMRSGSHLRPFRSGRTKHPQGWSAGGGRDPPLRPPGVKGRGWNPLLPPCCHVHRVRCEEVGGHDRVRREGVGGHVRQRPSEKHVGSLGLGRHTAMYVSRHPDGWLAGGPTWRGAWRLC